jgi:hypothetical protein
MNPDGRPKTRSLEPNMVAIYRLIHQAMINQGSANVAAACRTVISDHANLRFFKTKTLSDGDEDDFLYDLCDNADNLRKRYYRALECSKDAEKYPHLHHTVARLSGQLDDDIQRFKELKRYYEEEEQAGRLTALKHNLPFRFSRKP